MTRGRREVFYLVLWAVAVIGLLQLFKPKPIPTKIYEEKHAPIELKKDEAKKVVVKNNKVIEAKKLPDGKVEIKEKYVPPDGKVEVIEKTDGQVVVKVKTCGVTFSPGLGAGVVGTSFGGYVYTRLAYYHRLGLGAGLGFNTNKEVIPFGTLTFHVRSNTFLLTGMGTGGKLVVGVGLDF